MNTVDNASGGSVTGVFIDESANHGDLDMDFDPEDADEVANEEDLFGGQGEVQEQGWDKVSGLADEARWSWYMYATWVLSAFAQSVFVIRHRAGVA